MGQQSNTERFPLVSGTVAQVKHKAYSHEGAGWFYSLVHSSPDLILVAEHDGTIRYVNAAVERLFGYSAEEFVGMAPNLHELSEKVIHPEDRTLALEEFARASEEPGQRRVVSLKARCKNGVLRDCEGHVTDLLDDPEVRGFVFVSRDVTERVRAEEEVRRLNAQLEKCVLERTAELRAVVEDLKESEEKFRWAFEAATVGMAHVAPDGRWLKINDQLLEIVGYEREQLLGLTFQDITHPEDRDKDLRYVRRMLAGEIKSYSIEKRYVRKDRSRVWVDLTSSLLRDSFGEPNCFVSMIEDVTPRKLAELVPEPLTRREIEILRLVSAGLTNGQAAKHLSYSLGTVKLDVQSILAKLGVQNRNRAVHRAVEIGLIPPAPSSP